MTFPILESIVTSLHSSLFALHSLVFSNRGQCVVAWLEPLPGAPEGIMSMEGIMLIFLMRKVTP